MHLRLRCHPAGITLFNNSPVQIINIRGRLFACPVYFSLLTGLTKLIIDIVYTISYNLN